MKIVIELESNPNAGTVSASGGCGSCGGCSGACGDSCSGNCN